MNSIMALNNNTLRGSSDVFRALEIDVEDYPGHPSYLTLPLTPVHEPDYHIRAEPLAHSTPAMSADLGSDGELSPTLSEIDSTFLYNTINDGPELDLWSDNAWDALGIVEGDLSVDIDSNPSTLLDLSLASSEFYSSESDSSSNHSNPGESPANNSTSFDSDIPSTPTSRPSNQQRTRRGQLSLRQKSQLEDAFFKCPNPTESQQRNLGKKIGITVDSVQKWFSKQHARCIRDNHQYLYDNLDIWMGVTSNRTYLLPVLSSSTDLDSEELVYSNHD
ncbi:unnamed protein product [Owenia fusiformis]|uniref:Uncharacterized protein n=1 Tax=Owenia fusiformis TaxID=6347 RepID=A0A8J1USW5_OWEFU|nr:unnamed protein product [Owenia fusiformis]